MATNLARAGVSLAVHDANTAAAGVVARLPGVVVAASPSKVAAECRVLFTCLPNDAVVREVYLGPSGVAEGGAPGLISCDCSTVSPEATQQVHAALATKAIDHLDTPMLGSQPQAVSGDIFFIVAGNRACLGIVAPYLEIMGTGHLYVGASGTANRVKLIHNGLAAVVAVAVAEALAVCVQSGVDPYAFEEVMCRGGGMAHGTYFERRARRIIDGDFSPTFMTQLMLKDARLAADLARAAEVPVPLLEEAARTYEETVAGGWSQDDFSAVTHVIEQRIGRRLSAR